MCEVVSCNVEFWCLSFEVKVLYRENYFILREKELYGKVYDWDLLIGYFCLW